MHQPPVSGTATFGRLPPATALDEHAIDLAILGVPFDGLVTFRPGARLGPSAIRQSSVLCRNYSQQMDVAVYERLRAADAGDLAVNAFDFEETFRQIEDRIAAWHRRGTAVVALGGDHSIVLPILRATTKAYPGLTVIHFDAHTDTSDESSGQRFHHGTWVRRAIEEGLVQGRHVFQIGIRGSIASADYLDFARQEAIQILDMPGFHDRDIRRAFLATLRQTAGSGPCYLTFDVDGVDPAFAPGTGTPVVGGLTSFEAIDMMRACRGLQVVGGDVVEVAPAYDCSGITSLLGAAIAYEIAALIAITRAPSSTPAIARPPAS